MFFSYKFVHKNKEFIMAALQFNWWQRPHVTLDSFGVHSNMRDNNSVAISWDCENRRDSSYRLLVSGFSRQISVIADKRPVMRPHSKSFRNKTLLKRSHVVQVTLKRCFLIKLLFTKLKNYLSLGLLFRRRITRANEISTCGKEMQKYCQHFEVLNI
jgi:hypothetical protein